MSLTTTFSSLIVSEYDTNSIKLKLVATFNNSGPSTLNTINHIGYFRITLSKNANLSSPWYFRCDPKTLLMGETTLSFSTDASTASNRTVLSSFSYSNITYYSENTDLDIYDANKGNLLTSNQLGGTIYYKIEVMAKTSHAALSSRSGSFTLPPKFSFNAYTDFTNTSQTHTNESLNYQASWEGANTYSLYKDMRIKVKRVTTNGGNTMVGGTSEVSFTDTNTSLRNTSGSDLNNILTSQLFPNGTYESDTTHYFRYTLEALGTNGTVLDTDTNSFSKNVFPKMLCNPGSRFTNTGATTMIPVDNTDMYAAVNTQGNVIVGMRYGLQFKGVGSFMIDTATASPEVKVYKEGSVTPHDTISINGYSIGTSAAGSTDELFYYDTWGSSYDAGQQGTANQGNYILKASYKARGGNLVITNDNSSSKYSTFNIDLPYHRFPTSGFTAHRMLHYLDSSTQKLKISFINGNDDGDSGVVSLTNHSSGFSYKFFITETVVNSIKASNINTQSSRIGHTTAGNEPGNMYSFPWTALLQDEIYYVARFVAEGEFSYSSPNDSHYTYWKTKFDNFGLSVPTAGSKNMIGQFSDNSDGLNLLYQSLLASNPSLASTFNGVYMHGNAGSGRLSELVPTSASAGSVNGTYAFSGNTFRFIFSSDPDTYFSNSTPKVAFGVKVNYIRKDNGVASESNIVVYNSAGSILGTSDGVNGAAQSLASTNGLISNRGSLSDLRTITDGTTGGQHYREITLNINYENSNFNFIGGLDTTQNITHEIYYYVEESINSTLDAYWSDILPGFYKTLLADQGLTGMVYLDGSRDYRYPTGWRTLSISHTKNLNTILSGHNHITSSGGVPSAEGFNAQLTATTGQVVSSIDYEPTNNTKSLPFSQSEEIVGYYLVTNQIDGSSSTSINTITFSGNDSDWGANLQTGVGANSSERYSLTNTINLDVSAFDVRHDVEYSVVPFITSRTSFDGVNKENSSIIGFNTIGDSSIIYPGLGTVLGKSLTKNYQSEMVPNFSEIEFITPVDNTDENSSNVIAIPQVDVKFKYNSSEFASSSGNYFASSRENIRIERVLVQGGVEYIPADETSRINDGDIFSISNSVSGSKNLFTLSDTFGHAAQANDIVASGVDANSIYLYRYTLIPGFVYNPGGGGEKKIEFPSMANNTFDIIPTNLSVNLGLISNLNILYNPGHSQEILWDYVYSESHEIFRTQGDTIYFEIYSRIREDNDRDDSDKKIKYDRKKLNDKKSASWVLRDSINWDLSSHSSSNIGDTSSFQRVLKYDEFEYNHRTEIAVLVKITGGFNALSHTLGSNANGGINTSGMAVKGTLLEPNDFKKVILHSDEEKSLINMKFAKSFEEFTFNNNLEQTPISITRKKARIRGDENNPSGNKPYSSST